MMSRNLWVAAHVLFVALRLSTGSGAVPTSESHMASTRRLEAIASIADLEADVSDASCRLLQVDAREASKAKFLKSAIAKAISPAITDALPDPDAPTSPPKKTKRKVILMLLEMVPLCGPIGLDRFYLGCTNTALAKLTVCLCTCLVGGLVWGLIDAIIVVLNCLSRKQSINSLGLEAEFDEDDTEPAVYLACSAVLVQILCFCFCTGWCYMGSKQAPKEDTVIIGAPAGAHLISSAR